VCEALECDRASLFLYDPQNRELFTRVATELEIAEIRHSIDLGIAGWVARQREIVNVSQPALDPRCGIPALILKPDFRQKISWQLRLISKHDSRLVGVLEVLNKRVGTFDEFDEQLLQALCDSCSRRPGAVAAFGRSTHLADAGKRHCRLRSKDSIEFYPATFARSRGL